MPTDDPREPRFGSLGVPEPIRPDQVRYEAEPETRAAEFQPMFPMESGSRNLWRLIGGIAAAIILVVGIIVATRNSPTPATTADAVATPDSTTTPASDTPLPTSSAEAPSTLERLDQPVSPSITAPPSSTVAAPPTPVTPRAAPSPPAAAKPQPQAAVPQPTAPVTPAVPHPATTAPAASSAEVSPTGPKHRRRGPSAAAPWLVQVGAFKSSAAGQSVVDHLARDGWAARTAAGSGGWTIVEVTGYRTKEEARRAAKSLAAKAHVPTLVRKIKTAHKTAGDDASAKPHPPKHPAQSTSH